MISITIEFIFPIVIFIILFYISLKYKKKDDAKDKISIIIPLISSLFTLFVILYMRSKNGIEMVDKETFENVVKTSQQLSENTNQTVKSLVGGAFGYKMEVLE